MAAVDHVRGDEAHFIEEVDAAANGGSAADGSVRRGDVGPMLTGWNVWCYQRGRVWGHLGNVGSGSTAPRRRPSSPLPTADFINGIRGVRLFALYQSITYGSMSY